MPCSRSKDWRWRPRRFYLVSGSRFYMIDGRLQCRPYRFVSYAPFQDAKGMNRQVQEW